MFCTPKEQETCDVEKRGCEGCYYENETPEKKIERLEIVKNMLDGEVKLLRNELQQEKEKNKKLEEVINNLAKGVRYLGTNEELTTEDIIKMFLPEEIKIDFDDFMKRWENEQHKKADLKDKIIDMMAKQISCLSRNLDNATNFERVSEEEYDVDFIKQYYFKKARNEQDMKKLKGDIKYETN